MSELDASSSVLADEKFRVIWKKALQWVKQVCYNTAVAKISRL